MARQLKRLLGAFAAAAACSTALAAHPLWISDVDGTLGTVNLADGAVTIVGQMPVIMTDIAFDATGHLWGVSTLSGLYTIDPANATATLVRSIDHVTNSLVFGPDGKLYGAHDELFTINPNTGALTMIGGWGRYLSSGDLAFVDGSLYLSSLTPTADTLFKINPKTGAGTQIGTGITSGLVYGLATSDDGHLYGVSGSRVLGIDTVTGIGQVIRTYDTGTGLGQAFGTAFSTEATAPVPEPPAAWLLGMGVLWWALRRWRLWAGEAGGAT